MKKKILIIDDDRTNLKLIQNGLLGHEFETEVAEDGDVGLEKVKAFVPELIVLDIQMPRMNGYTFMLELKKIKRMNSVPIIVLTAHNEWEPIFRYKGVRDYMVKPIQFEQLLEKINKWLDPVEPPPSTSPGPTSDEKFH